MRKNTTRALIVALVLAVSSTATATEAAGKAPARSKCKTHHVCKKPKRRPAPLPPDYAQWSRVARCEEGGWNDAGGNYPDAIGIDYTNYVAFGGHPLPAGRATRAEIIAQIKVGDRLIRAYHMGIPDQYGCAAW